MAGSCTCTPCSLGAYTRNLTPRPVYVVATISNEGTQTYLAVHHKGPVLHDGLPDGRSSHKQESHALHAVCVRLHLQDKGSTSAWYMV